MAGTGGGRISFWRRCLFCLFFQKKNRMRRNGRPSGGWLKRGPWPRMSVPSPTLGAITCITMCLVRAVLGDPQDILVPSAGYVAEAGKPIAIQWDVSGGNTDTTHLLSLVIVSCPDAVVAVRSLPMRCHGYVILRLPMGHTTTPAPHSPAVGPPPAPCFLVAGAVLFFCFVGG